MTENSPLITISKPLAEKLGHTQHQKYFVLEFDLDAPFPSFSPPSPILHWAQLDLTIQPNPAKSGSGSKTNDLVSFVSSGVTPRTVASYVPAAPPPISYPHRYLFLLYEQPDDLSSEAFGAKEGVDMSIRSRMRWDMDDWVKRTGLDGKLVASNVVRCS